MDRVVGMPGSRCDTAIGFGDCEVLEVADGSPDVGGGIDPDGGHRNHDHSKRVVIEYFFAWVGNIVLLCFKAFGVRLERSNDDFCCRRMGHYGGVCGKPVKTVPIRVSWSLVVPLCIHVGRPA